MNEVLFEKVLTYITYEKSIPTSIYIPDKIFYKMICRKFILNKFLEKWMVDISNDPIDIIDSMLMNYYYWEDCAIKDNNEIIDLYDIYIRNLLKLKKYIIKENKL